MSAQCGLQSGQKLQDVTCLQVAVVAAPMNVSKQVSQIEVAFADVAKPAMTLDGILDEHEPRDDLWVTAFIGYEISHWTEIEPAAIEAEKYALTALNPKACLFFLPAYLVHVLSTKGRSEVTDMVIYFLDLGDTDVARQWKMERFKLLSHSQSRAVVCFLESAASRMFEADVDAATVALKNYWSALKQVCDDAVWLA